MSHRTIQPRRVAQIARLFFAVTILFAASSCTRDGASASGAADSPRVLRVGYQKSSLLLNLLREHGDLEAALGPGTRVEWKEFVAGPQMLEALNVGSVDVGHVGETPPIFAQAAGTPIVYAGCEAYGPKAEAILVAGDSKIATVADLRGNRVALNKGSNVHYFVLKALARDNLAIDDIEWVFLSPADARAAFERGSVDAWAIWDPFLAAAEASGARVLVDGEGLVANRGFYLATRELAGQQAETLKVLLDTLAAKSDWAKNHRDEVVAFLSNLLGMDPDTVRRAEARRNYGIQPIDENVVAYQQEVADAFHRLKLIPVPIRITDALAARRP